MPTFHVTAPDGHVLEITGPEGSTQEQALEQAKKQYQPKGSNTVDPPQSFLDKTISNIPSSLGKVLSSPYGEGSPAPGAKENYAKGEYPEQFQDALPKIKNFAQHPIDTIKDTIAENPVQSAMGVAALGRQGMPETAAKVDNAMSSVGKGLKVAAPNVASGGAQVAAGEILAKVPGMEWPARIGLGYPGARQIGQGMREGFSATKEAFKAGKVKPPESLGPSNKWMTEPDINIKPNLSDVPVGPVNKPTLPSGRTVGGPSEMPVAAPEVKQVQPETKVSTQGPVEPETQPEAPKGQQTAPESATEKLTSSDENMSEPDQWTWDSLKEKHGQDSVDRVRAKYSDLADRIKAAEIPLDKFLKLPQEQQDAIVKIPKHPTNPKRSKYSSGYNPKYENLFKELHGGD